MTQSLSDFSEAIVGLATSASLRLAAIRIGSNRHVTGMICAGDLVTTVDQALPASDSYTVVLPNGQLAAARPAHRDPTDNLAILRLDSPFKVLNPQLAAAPVGSVVVMVGAEADASPTVRLTLIHRLLRTADGPAPILDLQRDFEPGCLVLDVAGRLVGLSTSGPNREPTVILSAVIARILMPQQQVALPTPIASVSTQYPGGRRGWLGVALQPITVPDSLVVRAGQSSGRMVVTITRNGPAEQAGLRVGDVLLALNGTSASGPQALRAFLESERIGSTVEVKFLRDGATMTTHLTIALQPG